MFLLKALAILLFYVFVSYFVGVDSAEALQGRGGVRDPW